MTPHRELQDGPALEYLNELASGPLGQIWLALVVTGNDSGKLVFARRLSLDLLSPTELALALEAAREAVQIDHARLARLLGAYCQHGEFVVLSEYVGGVPLTTLRRMVFEHKISIPPPVALRVVHDVMRGAQALRRECVRAGRTCPSRVVFVDAVLVTSTGSSVLTNIGVSGVLYRCEGIRKRAEMVEALAPEEIEDSHVADERADVFALGVILWELLAGRRLFSGESCGQMLDAVAHEPVPPLDRVQRAGPKLPDTLVGIVKRATARDPKLRYSSLPEMRAAIDWLPSEHIATDAEVQALVHSIVGGRTPDSQESVRSSGLRPYSVFNASSLSTPPAEATASPDRSGTRALNAPLVGTPGASVKPHASRSREGEPSPASAPAVAFDEASSHRQRHGVRVSVAVSAALALTAAAGASVFRVRNHPESRPPLLLSADPSVLVRSAVAAAQPSSQPEPGRDSDRVSSRTGPISPAAADNKGAAAALPRPVSLGPHTADGGSGVSVSTAPPSAAGTQSSAGPAPAFKIGTPEGTAPVSGELTDADSPNGRWGI